MGSIKPCLKKQDTKEWCYSSPVQLYRIGNRAKAQSDLPADGPTKSVVCVCDPISWEAEVGESPM